jgi:hypothetical protein
MIKRWWFSIFLGTVYLGAFELWSAASRSVAVFSGLGATLLAGAVFGVAVRRRYFFNRWDALVHLAVITDILLEGVLVPVHAGRGFYGCAAGFGAVLVVYRAWLGRKRGSMEAVTAG